MKDESLQTGVVDTDLMCEGKESRSLPEESLSIQSFADQL